MADKPKRPTDPKPSEPDPQVPDPKLITTKSARGIPDDKKTGQ